MLKENKNFNVLDKSDQSLAPIPGLDDHNVTRAGKWNWNPIRIQSVGEFKWIDKRELNIDSRYQREAISEVKILKIAKNWDWKLFGAISVIGRVNGEGSSKKISYWVYDGGHRTRASFKRAEISALPCMVFKSNDIREEALAFYGKNLFRKSVHPIDRFRALVVAGDEIALKTKELVERHGYEIKRGESDYKLVCVQSVYNAIKRDQEIAEAAFRVTYIVYEPHKIHDQFFRAVLFILENTVHLNVKVFTDKHLQKLKEAGPDFLRVAFDRAKSLHGKGGNRVDSQAIFDILNKGKQHKYKLFIDEIVQKNIEAKARFGRE